MLTIVLPLLVLAVALTPAVVSARMTYSREMAAQADYAPVETQIVTPTAKRPSSVSVKTLV